MLLHCHFNSADPSGLRAVLDEGRLSRIWIRVLGVLIPAIVFAMLGRFARDGESIMASDVSEIDLELDHQLGELDEVSVNDRENFLFRMKLL